MVKLSANKPTSQSVKHVLKAWIRDWEVGQTVEGVGAPPWRRSLEEEESEVTPGRGQ